MRRPGLDAPALVIDDRLREMDFGPYEGWSESELEADPVAATRRRGRAQRAFAERIGMTEASDSYWKDSSRTPSLAAMLRVCRAAGFRLGHVLLGDLEAVRSSEAPEGRPYVAPSLETHRVLDPGETEATLRAAMGATRPPSRRDLPAVLDAHDPSRLDTGWRRTDTNAGRDRVRRWSASGGNPHLGTGLARKPSPRLGTNADRAQARRAWGSARCPGTDIQHVLPPSGPR